MLFQREGIWGEEGSRRDSSTPNQGSKPWIMEKKGPKSEITEPISEPPPGSDRSVTLLMPFQAPSEGRQHFTRAEPQIPRAFPNPSRNCSRTGWHSPLSCVLEKRWSAGNGIVTISLLSGAPSNTLVERKGDSLDRGGSNSLVCLLIRIQQSQAICLLFLQQLYTNTPLRPKCYSSRTRSLHGAKVT